MAAPFPTQTITGTTANDVRASTFGAAALVQTFQGVDTITLNNGTDYLEAGDQGDTIRFGGAVTTLSNSIIAGLGADTLTFGTAVTNFGAAGASLYAAGNQGNDLIQATAALGAAARDAFIGGGAGSDTVTFAVGAFSALTTSTIKGGDQADSITISSAAGGSLTNSIVEGNKGADIIAYGFTATNGGSIGGGLGVDTINLSTAVISNVAWINGGGGTDRIIGGTASVASIAGGGLADTINLVGYNGGVIYGDALGQAEAGSGTGGLADGNDSIRVASGLSSATSVYGAGGNDTIIVTSSLLAAKLYGGNDADSLTLTDGASATQIFGGNGADTIVLGTSLSSRAEGGAGQDSIHAQSLSALTVAGGEGADTIRFNNAAAGNTDVNGGALGDSIRVGVAADAAFAGSGSILGGDGADTIVSNLNFASAGNILGGAGNDSIRIGTGADLTWAANGTIDGGAGTDTISIAASAGANQGAGSGGWLTSGLASIAYGSGDVIFLTSTAAGGSALSNNAVYVATGGVATALGAAITGAAAGRLAAYSDGTDTYFTFATVARCGIAFRVTGKDLVTTTAVGAVGATTTTFGFTLGGSVTTGLTITLA